MALPQGYIHFNTGDRLISGSVTVSHGVMPNTFQLRCAPFPGPYVRKSELRFSYGSQNIRFRDCRLISIDFDTAQPGMQTMVLTVLDRRWRWKYGRIAGEYNIREGDGTVRVLHRKTPRELAKLCLDAMGEKKIDISQIPNDTFPYVAWDGNPAQALQELVSPLGCRVVYDPITDKITIARAGVGRQLPSGGLVMKDSVNAKDVEMPDKIIFVAGKTLWDQLVPLEAVGEEKNGSIQIIDKLSYRPVNGWAEGEPPLWMIMDGDDKTGAKRKHWRKVAGKCIWRWFRVDPKARDVSKVFPKKRDKLQIGPFTINNIEMLLPLETQMGAKSKIDLDTNVFNKDSIAERRPAAVYGQFYKGGVSLTDDEKDRLVKTALVGKNEKLGEYTRGFSIDAERGLVRMAVPVFRHSKAGVPLEDDNPSDYMCAPEIFLLTGFGVRHPVTNAWEREIVEFVPPGPKLGTLPHYIYREDIQRVIRLEYQSPTMLEPLVVDNLPEVRKQAKYYINEYIQQLQMLTPGTRAYSGMVMMSPDGAIQQISYEIDGKGFTTTMISRNQEYIRYSLSFEEKARLVKMDSSLKEGDKEKTKRKKA